MKSTRHALALCGVAVGSMLVMGATATPALAHTGITLSSPKAGAKLERPPRRVTVTFSGEPRTGSLRPERCRQGGLERPERQGSGERPPAPGHARPRPEPGSVHGALENHDSRRPQAVRALLLQSRSVRFTGRRLLAGVAALLVTALGAPAAFAHVQVQPALVAPADSVIFTVVVPNERDVATVEVELQIPEGVIPSRSRRRPAGSGASASQPTSPWTSSPGQARCRRAASCASPSSRGRPTSPGRSPGPPCRRTRTA